MASPSSWSCGKNGQYLRLAVYLWGLLYGLRLFDLQFYLGDEGVALVNGWRIASGELPVRDFFEIIPPFSFLPTAFAFHILGPTLLAARAVTLLYALLLMLSIDALVGTVVEDLRLRALGVLIAVPLGTFYYPMPSHHWLADLLQIAAVLAIIGAVRPRRAWLWGLLAGALSALAVFTLQDQGGYFVLAIGLLFFPALSDRVVRERVALAWCSGGVAVLAAFVLYLLPCVSLREIWYQWVIFPSQNYGRVAGNTGTIWGGWKELLAAWGGEVFATHPFQTAGLFVLTALVFVLPLLGGVSALLALRGGPPRWKVGALAAGYFAAYATCLHRWATLNLVWAAPFALALSLLGLHRATRAESPWVRRMAWGTFGALFAATLAFSVGRFVTVSPYETFPVVTPSGTWRTQYPGQARVVQETVDAVSALVPRDGRLLCIGFTPLLNFMTQRPCPTGLNYYLFGYNTEAQARETIGGVQKAPGSYICMVRRKRGQAADEAFGRYVLENYTTVWQNEEFVLFAPGRAPDSPAR